MTDPYYLSPEWRALRLACLRRDGFRCYVTGCRNKAVVADHIKSRRDGGPDTLANLRSVCLTHDAQTKERPSGGRRNDGKAYVTGCDAQGRPLDPLHPWHPRQAH
jgi:5-methylcytosine-specific restriction endonuclease McrA